MSSSNDDKANKKKMDSRCPRGLDYLPENWCPLAVMRLKALRNTDKELTEEEENNLPGCPWAVNHQLANYCFFKYMADYVNPDNPPSDAEIAHYNNLSQETVKQIIKDAIQKIKDTSSIRELAENNDGESIVSDRDDDDSYYNILK